MHVSARCKQTQDALQSERIVIRSQSKCKPYSVTTFLRKTFPEQFEKTPTSTSLCYLK